MSVFLARNRTGKHIVACEDSRMLQQHRQHRIEQHYH